MQTPLMNWRRSLAICFGLTLALSSAPLSADVWDNDPGNEDDGNGTDNELFHGTVQDHDLASQGGVVDQDWYVVRSRAFSSYEVLVDSFQGEVWLNALPLDRVDSGGVVLTAGGNPPGGLGSSKSVRWANDTGTQVTDFIRVDGSGTGCGTTCTTNTHYTIRMWETTGAVARFNNASGQVTVLLLQNPTDYAINGTIRLWNTSGTLAGTQTFTLAAKQLLVFNTATISPGVGGSITITQDGRFGDLTGKSVALEPSTGFSFDSPMVYRPH
jgi:hypothetical protein